MLRTKMKFLRSSLDIWKKTRKTAFPFGINVNYLKSDQHSVSIMPTCGRYTKQGFDGATIFVEFVSTI